MSEPVKQNIVRFIYGHMPLGEDIAKLVWDHDLDQHTVEIEKEFSGYGVTSSSFNQFKWTVTFTRRQS